MYMRMTRCYMILYIEGAFSIKGTTRHPDSSGSLHARNGTINVLKTIFKINEGNVVFNQVDSFFPSVEFWPRRDWIERLYSLR